MRARVPEHITIRRENFRLGSRRKHVPMCHTIVARAIIHACAILAFSEKPEQESPIVSARVRNKIPVFRTITPKTRRLSRESNVVSCVKRA